MEIDSVRADYTILYIHIWLRRKRILNPLPIVYCFRKKYFKLLINHRVRNCNVFVSTEKQFHTHTHTHNMYFNDIPKTLTSETHVRKFVYKRLYRFIVLAYIWFPKSCRYNINNYRCRSADNGRILRKPFALFLFSFFSSYITAITYCKALVQIVCDKKINKTKTTDETKCVCGRCALPIPSIESVAVRVIIIGIMRITVERD